jgi:RNA polymerase Rpb1, domain 6
MPCYPPHPHSEVLDGEFRQLLSDLDIMRREVLPLGNGGVNIPVNLRRLIWNAQNTYGCGPARPPLPGDLRAVDVVARMKVRLHAAALSHNCSADHTAVSIVCLHSG